MLSKVILLIACSTIRANISNHSDILVDLISRTNLNSGLEKSAVPITNTVNTPQRTAMVRHLDQTCGKGIGQCDTRLCCSEHGFCGYTTDHCGTNCQSQYGSGDDGTLTTVNTGCSVPGTFSVTFDDGPS
ncbi:hypothetical protein K7432_017332, partial [Basidiobolus ranarum]